MKTKALQRVVMGVLALYFLESALFASPSYAFLDRLRRLFSGQSAGPSSDRARGGSTRSGACRSEEPLISLMPVLRDDKGNQIVAGSTSSDHPTFWFYLPYSLTPNRPAELVVEEPDPQDSRYTQQRSIVRLTQAQPGVISIRLPKTEAPLAYDRFYSWKFVVHCNPLDSSENQFVDVSMVRLTMPPSLAAQLEKRSDLDKAKLYLNAGFWDESITILGNLRRQDPKNPTIEAAWKNLLKTINLEDISAQPVDRCCEVKP